MKKNILALAVAGVMAAPAVSLAAGPTLYGQANQSLDYLDNSDISGLRYSSNSSRLGVKGSHDLGGGLSAIYLFEFGVDVGGSDQNTLTNRNQFAGFKHDTFGTLVMGRHDTPMKVIGRKVDLFWSTQLGQNRSITNVNGTDARANQVVGYISPNFGPVHAFLAYVPNLGGTSLANEMDNQAFSGALIYDQGGLFVAAGYDYFEAKGNAAVGNEDNTQHFRLTGKYTFGNFTVAGFYERDMNINFNSEATVVNNVVTAKGGDQNLAGGGLAYKMNAETFKGQLYYGGDFDGKDSSDVWLLALGWDHAFSKSTQAYLQVAGMQAGENSGGLWSLGGSGHGTKVVATPDDTTWGISGGWRIKF